MIDGLANSVKPISCSDIVAAYGTFLEETPYGVGGTLPTYRLPYPVNIIKEALSYEAARNEDTDQKSFLRTGFLELAALTDDWMPTIFADPNLRIPETGSGVGKFFSSNQEEIAKAPAITKRIIAKQELLEEEWRLRLQLQIVAKADRIVE